MHVTAGLSKGTHAGTGVHTAVGLGLAQDELGFRYIAGQSCDPTTTNIQNKICHS